MEIWPQRPLFREAVKTYRETAPAKLADVAEGLGIKESTLKDYLYRRDVKPSLEVLQRASKLFGRPIADFVDDPGSNASTRDQSETRRFFMARVMKSASSEDLTDEDIEMLWQAWTQAEAQLRALKARMKA